MKIWEKLKPSFCVCKWKTQKDYNGMWDIAKWSKLENVASSAMLCSSSYGVEGNGLEGVESSSYGVEGVEVLGNLV